MLGARAYQRRHQPQASADLTEQVLSVRRVLAAKGGPRNAADVARRHLRAAKARIESALSTLVALGQVRYRKRALASVQ
jgi:hypothetical protein